MPFVSRGGQRVFYETAGVSGETVLFAHNLFCNRTVFAPHVQALAATHRVINVDLRGHGESVGTLADFSVGNLADDLAAVLDAEGVARATVVGQSLGGCAAMQLAIAHASRVARLVLFGTTGRSASASDRWLNGALAWSAWIAGVRPFVARRTTEVLFGASFRRRNRATVSAWADRVSTLRGRDAYHGVRAWTHRPRLIERLATIEAPTLVVVGGEDVACPRPHGEALQRAIRGARIAELPDAGHTMSVERPDETLALIREHLAVAG